MQQAALFRRERQVDVCGVLVLFGFYLRNSAGSAGDIGVSFVRID